MLEVNHWISFDNGYTFNCPNKWSQPHKNMDIFMLIFMILIILEMTYGLHVMEAYFTLTTQEIVFTKNNMG